MDSKCTICLKNPEVAQVVDTSKACCIYNSLTCSSGLKDGEEYPLCILDIVNLNCFRRVKILLKEGADVNSKDKGGYTLLMLASRNGNRDIVELLVKYDANVNAVANGGCSALTLASQYGHIEVVEFLINNCNEIDADSEANAITWASLYGYKEIVEMFLKKNASLVNSRGVCGFTPLIFASSKNNFELVYLLIQKGASLDTMSNSGRTALMSAVFGACKETLDLLIQEGAGVNVCDGRGFTALMSAAGRGNTYAVKLLIEKGASVRAVSDDNETALELAERNNHLDIVDYLKEHCA